MENRWQDCVGLVLGILLVVSPWVVGFSELTMAAASAWIIGLVTIIVFGIAVAKPQQWDEWVNLVLAIVLLLSPFVLGFTGVVGAAWSHWILAILIGVDAIWALVASRRQVHRLA